VPNPLICAQALGKRLKLRDVSAATRAAPIVCVPLPLYFPSHLCDGRSAGNFSAARESDSASDEGHLASKQAQGLFELAIPAERHSQRGIRRIACRRRRLGSVVTMHIA